MQSRSFTKLFSSITDSSVWDQPDHVVKVWVTLLAMADGHGVVYASVPGLAARSRKTIAEVEEALTVFRSPDPYSRTKAHEGRRIVDVDGGWYLLNYESHRNTAKHEASKESKRAWAARRRQELRDQAGLASNDVEASRLEMEEVEAASNCPSASASVSTSKFDPEGVQGEPADGQTIKPVYRNLDGWEMSPSLRDEAIAAGVPPEDIDERVRQLRLGPIGGRRGTHDRDDYVRSLFPKWRTWAETDRANERARAAARVTSGFRCHAPWEPTSKHKAFAQKHGLDLDRFARLYVASGVPERRSLSEANEDFGKRLGLVAKGKGFGLEGAA